MGIGEASPDVDGAASGSGRCSAENAIACVAVERCDVESAVAKDGKVRLVLLRDVDDGGSRVCERSGPTLLLLVDRGDAPQRTP